ncbi:hypothetical protein [Candidatus Stoquefichus sp. SB1]|jgi:hypothetical protein|uniref:Uncharacterized protein n=1 Tax=Siphoviridae sp. ctQtc11 TaxID=2825497 RepID=A0A8S5P5K4_9CAUD|nr:hypothetical protein [Candidatus Stoquefichus sp. SB1]DAE01468.1 MAG TPA: hypothetical protein [Siphoviridae sp. ctQtc11]
MKVEIEYTNDEITCFEDILDVVFCSYDIEIYLRRDDVNVIPTSKIKSVKVTDL